MLGLGNSLRKDDRIGLYLIEKLKDKFKNKDIDFLATEEMGFSLLDIISGYEKLIIIDSILTGEKEVGFIHEIKIEDLLEGNLRSSHYAGIPDLYILSKKLNILFPEKILILAIEVRDPFEIKEDFSEELKEKIFEIERKVEEKIKEFLNGIGI
ncbi:MAG: hydrogenase maturation protease [candidate division WOR-3 bacterium]